MSDKQTDATRRRLLKGIGATGLALGAMGTATANDGEAPRSAESEDGATTQGWEYRCLTDVGCRSGPSCQEEKRYCANGDCSGWEYSGCCGCI